MVMEVNGYKIEPGAILAGVKVTKFVRGLVVAVVFLAGCSSSDSSSTTTTVAADVTTTVAADVTTTVAQARIVVNGYKIEPGAKLKGAKTKVRA